MLHSQNLACYQPSTNQTLTSGRAAPLATPQVPQLVSSHGILPGVARPAGSSPARAERPAAASVARAVGAQEARHAGNGSCRQTSFNTHPSLPLAVAILGIRPTYQLLDPRRPGDDRALPHPRYPLCTLPPLALRIAPLFGHGGGVVPFALGTRQRPPLPLPPHAVPLAPPALHSRRAQESERGRRGTRHGRRDSGLGHCRPHGTASAGRPPPLCGGVAAVQPSRHPPSCRDPPTPPPPRARRCTPPPPQLPVPPRRLGG